MTSFPRRSASESTSSFTDIFGNDEHLPTARLISPTDQEQGYASAVSFAPEYGFIVENAIAVPSEDGILSSSDVQRNGRTVTNLATRRGRMSAEQELEDIQRANMNVRAHNYFVRADVDEANRLLLNHIQLGDLSRNYTIPMDSKKVVTKPINSHSQQAALQGTFGKDYEVSNYDVNEYSTKDYEVSTYKSVYEK